MIWCTVIFLTVSILYFVGGYVIVRRTCVRRQERIEDFEHLFSKRRLALASPSQLREDFDWFDSHRSRELCTLSYDGLRLFGTLIEAPKEAQTKGVVILFHGYRSTPRRDFCIQMRLLHEAGYHLLAVNQRSHSRSEGKYICYGIKERYDVITWRKLAAEIFGAETPVALMGLSMGAATVLMASELVDKEDTALRCVVADCPFSSASNIIKYVMKDHNKVPLSKILFTATEFWARTLADLTFSSPSSAQALANSHLPALLIHGEEDDYVPISHSEEIEGASSGRARLVRIANAKHSEAIYNDKKRYADELLSFLDLNMKY